jgi:putative addiction module CopG family antidote
MNVSIGDRFKHVIAEAVESGNYSSPEDVVTEAMRLFAQRHEDYMALKASIAEALADPRYVTDNEIDAALAATDAELASRGIPE